MNKPIHDDQINKVLLKPRIKIEMNENEEEVLNKFKNNLNNSDCKYCSKITDNHVIVDVPENEDHFWSPQLHVEIEKDENKKTIVRGVLGPKPQVWTFFMFLHFAVALAFIVFFVIFYSNWSLNQDYTFAMIMCIVMPIIWIALYFFGQLGKKFGYNQMVELHNFLMNTLDKKN
ncbi:MAG: GTP-binding protein [Flavobacteriaceae bacterium]|nr:GTP-binding protein [Flavobacteriaceae bacterium]